MDKRVHSKDFIQPLLPPYDSVRANIGTKRNVRIKHGKLEY